MPCAIEPRDRSGAAQGAGAAHASLGKRPGPGAAVRAAIRRRRGASRTGGAGGRGSSFTAGRLQSAELARWAARGLLERAGRVSAKALGEVPRAGQSRARAGPTPAGGVHLRRAAGRYRIGRHWRLAAASTSARRRSCTATSCAAAEAARAWRKAGCGPRRSPSTGTAQDAREGGRPAPRSWTSRRRRPRRGVRPRPSIATKAFLSARRDCGKKLRDADQGLVELDAGWNNSSQAMQCLRELFVLLGRLGRHEDSTGLRPRNWSTTRPSGGSRRRWPTSWPNCRARIPTWRCGDAAAEMREADRRGPAGGRRRERTGAAVRVAARLAPEDLLLGRDGRRFAYQRRPRRGPPGGGRRASSRSSRRGTWA